MSEQNTSMLIENEEPGSSNVLQASISNVTPSQITVAEKEVRVRTIHTVDLPKLAESNVSERLEKWLEFKDKLQTNLGSQDLLHYLAKVSVRERDESIARRLVSVILDRVDEDLRLEFQDVGTAQELWKELLERFTQRPSSSCKIKKAFLSGASKDTTASKHYKNLMRLNKLLKILNKNSRKLI